LEDNQPAWPDPEQLHLTNSVLKIDKLCYYFPNIYINSYQKARIQALLFNIFGTNLAIILPKLVTETKPVVRQGQNLESAFFIYLVRQH